MPDTEHIRQLLHELLTQQRTDSALLSGICVRMEMLEALHTVVFRGRGEQEPSILTQIATINHDVSDLKTWRFSTDANLLLWKTERARGHWLVLSAIIAGTCTFAAAMFAAMNKLWR